MNNLNNDERQIIGVSGEDAKIIQMAEDVEIAAAARAQENCPAGLIAPLMTFDTEAEREIIGKRIDLQRRYQMQNELQLPPILVPLRQSAPHQPQVVPGNIVRYHRGAPSDMELAQILLNRVTLRRQGEQIYQFNGRYYERLTTDKFHTLIYDTLREELSINGSSKQIRSVAAAIMAEPFIEVKADDFAADMICLQNGVLNLHDFKLYAHSPQYFLTWMMDVNYMGQQPCPTCDFFFEYAAGGNPVLIQRNWEALAYAIIPDDRAKRFILLMGLGDTGKSVWGDLAASFFMPEAVGSVDIFRLGDRFSLSTLVYKRLNISMDLTDAALHEQAMSIIKQITGRDLVQVEEKYKTPYAARIGCKLIFGTNHRLRTNSYDLAFWKRVLYLPFEHPVPHHLQNPNLRNLLRQERPGIFWKALEAYKRLLSTGFVFSGDDVFDIARAHQTGEQTADMEEDLKQFISTHCVEKADGFVTTDELYESYQAFCRGIGHESIVNKQAFSMRFKALCPGYENKKKRVDGVPRNGYCGLMLI